MSGLLELDTVLKRIVNYAERWAAEERTPPEARYILHEVFLRGEIARGEVARLTGRPDRTARRVLARLLNVGWLCQTQPRVDSDRVPGKVRGILLPALVS